MQLSSWDIGTSPNQFVRRTLTLLWRTSIQLANSKQNCARLTLSWGPVPTDENVGLRMERENWWDCRVRRGGNIWCASLSGGTVHVDMALGVSSDMLAYSGRPMLFWQECERPATRDRKLLASYFELINLCLLLSAACLLPLLVLWPLLNINTILINIKTSIMHDWNS